MTAGPSVGDLPGRSFDAMPATPEQKLDELLGKLSDRAREFARLPVMRKVEMLRALMDRTREVSDEWVRAACKAKGIDYDSPMSGEEWVAGPAVTIRNMRQLADSLEQVARSGKPHIDPLRVDELAHGAISVRTIPGEAFDKALYGGMSVDTWMLPEVSRRNLSANTASFYDATDPEGGVSLVLGAGNVSSIPPMDVLYKMFVDGNVCVLKMNPVNEYLGPVLERAFGALIEAGYLAVVYGGAEVGSYLCEHAAIADIHITGSDKTHDLIVWGPAGPEREARKERGEPINPKPITSELGNVSPVMVVPGPYDEDELTAMAANIAGMITNNASFNCNAAKMLILPKGWRHRETLLRRIADQLARVPPRKAYYPGARDRWESLTAGRETKKVGDAGADQLPWTLVTDVDSSKTDDRIFRDEPFCAMLSVTEIASDDPEAFLDAAVPFANDVVWGTLNSMLFVHPKVESDPGVKSKLDGALRDLRHGTVAINVWPALVYAFATPPWGGHPSATLADIQSGLGWVHNTLMLENIEKNVLRAPLKPFPKLAYVPGHKTIHRVGRKLVDFEAKPSWLKVPSIAIDALRG